MKKTTVPGSGISRRRFVGLLAAGSAALAVPGGAGAAAAAAAGATKRAAGATADLSPADRRELQRQKTSTHAVLETIRNHAMPPGTELAGVFLPQPQRKRNR